MRTYEKNELLTMDYLIQILSSQGASKSHVICVKPTVVNLMPCCIKHISRCFWY